MDVSEEKNNAEIMKNAMEEFKDIPEYMALAKEENAIKTYAKLKEQYLLLKALLNSLVLHPVRIRTSGLHISCQCKAKFQRRCGGIV